MIKNINEAFPSEKVCYDVLRRLHLDFLVKSEVKDSTRLIADIINDAPKEKIICPRCGNHNIYNLDSGKYPFKCTGCQKRFDERTETIFQSGQLSIRQYFIAVFLYYANQRTKKSDTEISHKRTDTGTNLAKILDVSEKTAYEVLRKIKFIDKEYSKLSTDEVKERCVTLKIKCKTKKNGEEDEKLKNIRKYLSANKNLLKNINRYLNEDKSLSLVKTVLRQDPISFMPYIGSKRSLLLELITRLPKKFNNYYEPFVGGGSLFFALGMMMQSGINLDTIDNDYNRQMYISDYNKRLIDLYKLLANDPKSLIDDLKIREKEYNAITSIEGQKEYFKHIVEVYNDNPNTASDLIFLTKNCNNGRYEFNKDNKIRASYGYKQTPFKLNEDCILRCSKILKQDNIHIANQSYEEILKTIKAGDFVYADVPYISYKENPINYGTDLTSLNGQKEIRDFLLELHNKGVFFMTSNYYCDYLVRNFYSDTSIFNVDIVYVNRVISGKNKREAEVIIRNYS